MTSDPRDTLTKNDTNPFITKLIEEENLKLSEISKIYPYNALWAQLGDLYGAITSPMKLSKTIICGNDSAVRTIERLLNILTYFIRCSEIRRNSHTKVFDKDEVSKIVNHQLNQKKLPETSLKSVSSGLKKKSGGLTRTATTVKDLSKAIEKDEVPQKIDALSELEPETYRLLMKILKKNVMNDIPKVLAFRDSRFVKQELRIGNQSMDTGIEMSEKDRQYLSKYQKNVQLTGDHIKLTVTRPDNDGIEETIVLDDDHELRNQLDNFISLSNLITENSLGGAQNVMKMFWEKNQFKDALNLEQIKHLERLSAAHQLHDEKLNKIPENNEDEPNESSNSVVFVLGDDEKLVGLKTSPSMQTIYAGTSGSSSETTIEVCRHNKKHSGVKFNFEKYPQIATNYMKSKNLEFSEMEVLEKGMKLEREEAASTSQLRSSSTTLQSIDSDSDEECECCKNGNGLSYLTTPSNATELEFSSDQHHESSYLIPLERNLCNESASTMSSTSNFSHLQTLDEDQELKCEDNVKIVEVPMLDNVKKQSVQDEILRPGFTSSLFTSASDHYISDMILQVRQKLHVTDFRHTQC